MAKRKLKEHLINREWCKGCGICIAFLDMNRKALKLGFELGSAAV